MKVIKTSRAKNSHIFYKRSRDFRYERVVIPKKNGQQLFIHSEYNNPYTQYELTSVPVVNGPYKIKVASVDDYDNENSGAEDTVAVTNYPLPAKNLEATEGDSTLSETRYSITTNGWNGVVYSEELDLFVTVGFVPLIGTQRVQYSNDGGQTWNGVIDLDSYNWYSICWSSDLGLFVAVGEGVVAYSLNGINWSFSALAGYWSSVCWSSDLGLFVAVASNVTSNNVAVSSDGISWTRYTSSGNYLSSICWSSDLGLFVAVGASSGTYQIVSSSDGISWTGRYNVSANIGSICWSSDLGLFVAVGNSGTKRSYYSSDGINWNQGNINATKSWSGIAELNGIVIAVNQDSSFSYSINGIDWTNISFTGSNSWKGICSSNHYGYFITVASTGTNRVAKLQQKYKIQLDWEDSINGDPDNYIIYYDNTTGIIDKDTPLDTISGALTTFITDYLLAGTYKFIVESKVGSLESNSMQIVEITVPSSNTLPPKPGPDGEGTFGKTFLHLDRVSVGKVKISFFWLYGSQAEKFRVYYDNATGTVDYITPLAEFNRIDSLIQEYTTNQLHVTDEVKEYIFVVRAVSEDDVEEDNEDEYVISVDGAAPDDAESLVLETVF